MTEKIGLQAILDMTNFNKGTAEYMGSTSKMENATVSLDKKLANMGQTMMVAGAKMTAGVTLPLGILAAKAIDAASDLDESMNKVSVVFGKAADSVIEWSKTAAASLGVGQQQALEAAGTFGNLLTSMGMAGEGAATMSMDIVALASDLSSFNNIDPTVALEKLRSGLVGETEPLRALGVNLTAAAVEAEAMRLGLVKSGDELTAQAQVQARYSLILQQTTNAQGDFARTSDGLANSQRILKAEMADAAAELGKILLPLMTDAVGIVRDLVGKFGDLPDPVKKSGLALAGIAAAAGPLTTAIGGITKAMGLMIANPVVAGLALLAVGIAALVVHLQKVKTEAQGTAGEILTTSKSYEEYRRRCEDAGVASEIVVEGLYEIRKGADDATAAIDDLTFQKAADELAAFAEIIARLPLSEMTRQYQDAAVAQTEYDTRIRELLQSNSELSITLATNTEAVRDLGIEYDLTGDDLDNFVKTTTDQAQGLIFLKSRMAETSDAIQEERDQLRAAKGTHREYADTVRGVGGSLFDLEGRIKAVKDATAEVTMALDTQKLTAQLMAEAMRTAGEQIGSAIDTLVSKWGELTAAEREAAEVAIAQELMAQARQMLADGQITLSQYAGLWSAMVDQFGSLVDPAQATTDSLVSMLGQWALESGVTSDQFAAAIADMGLTMDTATADAMAAEAAFIAAFTGPRQSIAVLGTDIVTLGGKITEIPGPSPISFVTIGYDETFLQLQDLVGAAANLPDIKSINVNVNLTGSPDIMPLSPHTMMEKALDQLADTAQRVADLTVTITASADVIEVIQTTLSGIVELLKTSMVKALTTFNDAYKAGYVIWEERTRLFRDQLIDLYQVQWPMLTATVLSSASTIESALYRIDSALARLASVTLPTLRDAFQDAFGEVGTLVDTAAAAVTSFGTALDNVTVGPLTGLRDTFRDAFGGANGITALVSEAANAIRGMATDLYGARDAANALGPAFTTFKNTALPAIDAIRLALTGASGLNAAIQTTGAEAQETGTIWDDSWQAVLDTIYDMNAALDQTISKLGQIANGALMASYALELALRGGGTMALPTMQPATLAPATLAAAAPAGRGGAMPSINIGPVTIANGMDWAEFKAGVRSEVANALRMRN